MVGRYLVLVLFTGPIFASTTRIKLYTGFSEPFTAYVAGPKDTP